MNAPPTNTPHRDLQGRVAVVTGGTAGIGAATAKLLHQRGATVAVASRSGGEGAEFPDGVRCHAADLSDAGDVDDFTIRVTEELGHPSILVNNVGGSPSRNFLYMDDQDWFDLFELNVMSAVRCTRAFLPAMRKDGWGRVVMVSSGAAKAPLPATIDYGSTKAALASIATSLSKKYARDGVLVNTVLPGLIRTPMWERTAEEISAATEDDVEQVFEDRSAKVPVGRFGTADEVANLIGWLCSDAASYVTGTSIEIDGGLSSTML